MSARDELLDLMDAARRELVTVTDGLRNRLGDVANADGMTVRDLLVHYAGWQRVAVRRIGTRMAGGEVQPIEADDYNPLLAMLGRQWSDDEALWEFNDAYARLVDAVRAAPESECAPDGWAYRYAERTAHDHYGEHLPDLARLAGEV
jgi:hypothetical protein